MMIPLKPKKEVKELIARLIYWVLIISAVLIGFSALKSTIRSHLAVRAVSKEAGVLLSDTDFLVHQPIRYVCYSAGFGHQCNAGTGKEMHDTSADVVDTYIKHAATLQQRLEQNGWEPAPDVGSSGYIPEGAEYTSLDYVKNVYGMDCRFTYSAYDDSAVQLEPNRMHTIEASHQLTCFVPGWLGPWL